MLLGKLIKEDRTIYSQKLATKWGNTINRDLLTIKLVFEHKKNKVIQFFSGQKKTTYDPKAEKKSAVMGKTV